MVSDIYMFDLESFRWEKVAQSQEDDIPQARYFHSADTCTYLKLGPIPVTNTVLELSFHAHI